jgi:thioredoxin-like negative regulator of GroEL
LSESRREKLETMLANEPEDQFLRYALAMELDKAGETEKGLDLFSGLTRGDPPHVSAFFMAGQMLARVSRVDEARSFLRDGIEEARRQGDSHAAGEMSEFLTSLGSLSE